MSTVETVETRSTVLDAAREVTRALRRLDYYPLAYETESAPLAEVKHAGSIYTNFYSNSFLGIADHPKIKEAMKKAIDRYGTGVASARLVAAPYVHRQLEERIADFKHREAAVVFSAGMFVNLGVIPALASPPLRRMMDSLGEGEAQSLLGSVTIFVDEFCHSCIFDGVALSTRNFWGGSRARVHIYRHLDMLDLRRKLETDRSEQRIIATDGVFSVHGHVAPLIEITALAKEFGAVVYVDDAHGNGVLGPTGRGSAEMLGVDHLIDIPVGTFSKAFGCAGGFVAGDKDTCDYLRIASRTYVFETAMPPVVAAGVTAALDVAEEESWRRTKVLFNAQRVRRELEKLGFSTLGTQHHIVPVLMGDERVAVEVHRGLKERGILVGCIRYPAVPLGEALLRCNMMATHTEEHLDRFVSALKSLGRKHGVIP